jgi:hypothetical protein
VKTVELLIVQLEEASALMERQTAPHWRLSLILTDNVAELLFQQEASRLLEFMAVKREYVALAERGYPISLEDHLLEQFKREVVTLDRQRRIENDFSVRLGYLTGSKSISFVEARVFRKLHQYRNDTYHRERFREGTVATAARLYFDLVCGLLSRFTPTISMLLGRQDAEERFPSLAKYFDDEETGWLTQTSLGERVARALVPADRAVGNSLADHIVARLDQIERTAKEPLQLLDEDWTAEDVFRVVQLSEVNALNEVRRRRVKYRYEHIEKWRARAERLRICDSRLESFRQFAELEDEVEPIEDALEALALEVDHMVQFLIDSARGK